MGGLAKLYGLMALAVCVYLAVDRGHWVVLPVAAALWLLAMVAGRLLNNVVRKSRRGSRFALVSIFITWALVVTVFFLAGVAVLPYLGGAI
jgi:hypothetical protein